MKYRAFLSYSHVDTPTAKWLHAALEGFAIGQDLVGRETELGPIPPTLRPIFRDRDEFVAGASLNEQTLIALEQSGANDGRIVMARNGRLEMQANTPRSIAIPAAWRDKIYSLQFGPRDDLLVEFRDGAFGILANSSDHLEMSEGQKRAGFCPDGSIWLTSNDGDLTKSDGFYKTTRKLVGNAPMLLSNTCALYIDGDGDLYRLDNSTVQLKQGIAQYWQNGSDGRRFAFSRTDRYFAISGNDGEIVVYDLLDKGQFNLSGHTQRVVSMSFDEFERHILTESLDGSVRIFDLGQKLILELGSFKNARAVYSSQGGGFVASAEAFGYKKLSESPLTENVEVPSLPTGTLTSIRQDWRVGAQHLLADGDPPFVGICRVPGCPAGSVGRQLRQDFASGGGVRASASADGYFVATSDPGYSISLFDLRRPRDLPVLTIPDAAISSVSFDSKVHTLYLLRSDSLAVLPFGPREISERINAVAKFCLTAEEREHLFAESTEVAMRKAAYCAEHQSRSSSRLNQPSTN